MQHTISQKSLIMVIVLRTALTVTDVTFNNDGTVMYLADDSKDTIRQYDLATAFDITTATYDDDFDNTGVDIDVTGITFNNDWIHNVFCWS
jgi:hypothetical protein